MVFRVINESRRFIMLTGSSLLLHRSSRASMAYNEVSGVASRSWGAAQSSTARTDEGKTGMHRRRDILQEKWGNMGSSSDSSDGAPSHGEDSTPTVADACDESTLAEAKKWHARESQPLYSDKALVQRYCLRKEEYISSSLDEWWACIQIHLRKRGKPDALLDEAEYKLVFRKVFRAMMKRYSDHECEETIQEDWRHESKGQAYISANMVKDSLFELADIWTHTKNVADYVLVLTRVLCAIFDEREGEFRDDSMIVPGSCRPAGREEDMQANYNLIKSKVMSHAEAKAMDMKESRKAEQRRLEEQAAMKAARAKALAEFRAEESKFKRDLSDRLGRDPTAADIALAKDEALRQQLEAKLGVPPSELELQRARESAWCTQLTLKHGSPPSEAEMAYVLDREMKERLTGEYGRPPTSIEMAAARERVLRLNLHATLGRYPSQHEFEVAHEKWLVDRLRGEFGRVPTAAELAVARETTIETRLEVELRRQPTARELDEARARTFKMTLEHMLGRQPTESEVATARGRETKALQSARRLAAGSGSNVWQRPISVAPQEARSEHWKLADAANSPRDAMALLTRKLDASPRTTRNSHLMGNMSARRSGHLAKTSPWDQFLDPPTEQQAEKLLLADTTRSELRQRLSKLYKRQATLIQETSRRQALRPSLEPQPSSHLPPTATVFSASSAPPPRPLTAQSSFTPTERNFQGFRQACVGRPYSSHQLGSPRFSSPRQTERPASSMPKYRHSLHGSCGKLADYGNALTSSKGAAARLPIIGSKGSLGTCSPSPALAPLQLIVDSNSIANGVLNSRRPETAGPACFGTHGAVTGPGVRCSSRAIASQTVEEVMGQRRANALRNIREQDVANQSMREVARQGSNKARAFERKAFNGRGNLLMDTSSCAFTLPRHVHSLRVTYSHPKNSEVQRQLQAAAPLEHIGLHSSEAPSWLLG